MKARIDTKNKSSAKKKLIPAAGSLLISAAMLSTSTYAWFTMSREVEVKNIKMTATVPEDIQISLGHLQYVAGGTTDVTISTAKDHQGLANNEGILKPATGEDASDGNVQAPNSGNTAVDMLDWASSADVSEYYRLGKIIPASSTTGKNIYFTPDANGVGKTLKTGAGYYAAALGLTAQPEDREGNTGDGATTYKTTLHAINNTTEASDKWNDGTASQVGYTTASDWNNTEDDGYYVDIPVWLRTSSTEGAILAVDAYVTTDTAVDEDDLYLAARAVILPDGETKFGKEETPDKDTSGLIEVRKDSWTETESIVNFMTTTNNDGEAVNSLTATAAALGGKVAEYTTETHYDGDQLIKIEGKAEGANGYGTARKVWIRVWLEGEDPNCWNQNAGQNFNISLKFTKEAINPAVDGNEFTNAGAGQANNTETLVNGETHTVNFVRGGTTVNTLVYTYNNGAWTLSSGTYYAPGAGETYSAGATRAALDELVGAISTSTAAKTATTVTITTAGG